MGERKRRLIQILTSPDVNRAQVRRWWGLTDVEIDRFIEQNRRHITFKKITRMKNEVDDR